MADTPERFWQDWRPGMGVTNGPLACPPRTEWVRGDVCLALVAAAYEAAATECEDTGSDLLAFSDATLKEISEHQACADLIRSFTLTNAQEALDRLIAEKVAEERERCAVLAEKIAKAFMDRGWKCFDFISKGAESTADAIRKADTP